MIMREEPMEEPSEVKRLELRVQELENQLKQFQMAAAPQEISADEMAVYRRVRSALTAFDDWECGINECRPIFVCRGTICRICRVCRVCINECNCGPCRIGGGGVGGGFSGFGE
jgi:hypothetical protein